MGETVPCVARRIRNELEGVTILSLPARIGHSEVIDA